MSVARSWITTGVLLSVLPAAAAGQDIRYTEALKVEAFMSLPGVGDPIKSTTWVSGGRTRVDAADRATIMDYPGGRLTEMDHKAKTYYSLTFADMMAGAAKMMADARVQVQQAKQEARAEGAQEPEVKLEFDLKVDRLGAGPRISGYATEHVLLVLKAKATSATPDPETGEEVSGTMVFASEMWVSKDFPGYKALQDAQLKAAADLSPELRRQMEEMAESGREMMAEVPGIQGGGNGMQRMAEEMKKIEGAPLRSLTYHILLPDSVEFDRDALLAMADRPIPSFSFKTALAEGMKESVKDALTGGIAGRFGRRREPPKPDAAQAPASQLYLMRITSTLEEISTAPLADDVFKPVAGYREVQPAWLKSGG